MTKLRTIDSKPERLYAIGDIHGCVRELELLLMHLEREEQLTERDLVVFIGDYIDRGSFSKQVIDLLLSFSRRPTPMVFLRGNHEDMLLDFLGFPGNGGEVYLANGGREFFASYDVDLVKDPSAVIEKIPGTHLSFIQNLEAYVAVGDYVFVHAGLDPLRPLEAQEPADLYWIRDTFIANIHHFGRTVVFGHTPYHDVLFHLPYKIGIDTGLVYGNSLSCVELIGKKIMQVELGEKKVKTKPFPE